MINSLINDDLVSKMIITVEYLKINPEKKYQISIYTDKVNEEGKLTPQQFHELEKMQSDIIEFVKNV